VYFLYTYTTTDKDKNMKKRERSSIDQEVALLRESGLTVRVVEEATKADIEAAFSDPEAKMIVTSGHGYDDAKIQTSDKKQFTPEDLKDVSTSLTTVIFENCYQGGYKEDWEKALGSDTDVVGWEGTTTTSETKRFNNSGFFDRQSKKLADYIKEVIDMKEESSD